ncbi:MAG: VRR-NUC domain-containing protein [Actinomycetota bacterium]|nr:VRR-NUC domain-containing protein [Actinomycetota bacterium]
MGRPSLSEKAFQAQVVALARMQGWRVYHAHDSRRSEPGFPDLCMVRSPRVVYAELKTETGKLSPDQVCWLEELKACPGVETFVWRPSDWDEAREALTRRKWA